jgi:hypothetical protein
MKGIFMAIAKFFRDLFGGTPAPAPGPVTAPHSAAVFAGKKYALLIGINKYVTLQGSDLNGCVNDVNTIYEFLTKKRGFDPDNIRMLCDERATQQNILERLEWLVTVAQPGDELVLQYSGHGSSVRVRIGDALQPEECQCICPTDMNWDDPLIDKILAGFFKRIPQGAFLTFISDSCHSASQDRGLEPGNPHPIKNRFLQPPLDIAVRSLNRNLPVNRIGWKALTGPTSDITFIEGQRHMLISGCRDSQTSADAFILGKYQGAMTASLQLTTLDANDQNPWITAHANMLEWLKKNKYAQIPNLSGPKARLETGKVF